MSNANIIRRISTRTVLGFTMNAIRVSELVKEQGTGDVCQLYSAFGDAVSTRTGTTEMGDWTALLGSFVAINAMTGEQFSSPQLFLPEPLGSMLYSQVSQLEPGESVEVGVHIGARLSDDSPVGFEYVSQLLRDPTSASVEEQILERWKHALPSPTSQRLPGPKGGKGK